MIEAFRLPDGQQLSMDGKLDEEIWSEMPVYGDFTMQVPIEGGEPTEKSEIRIAFDRDNLYIAIKFYDDPNGIKAFQRKRDVSLATDDRFMWILDTFNDGRNAYFFEINPGGLMGDGLLSIGQGFNLNKAWNGIWRVWTHIGDFGWSAEIRIPFRSINFDPNNDTWGINFQRTIRRKNEELLWTGHRRDQGLWRPQNAGILTGLSDVSQGLGLEVVPYGIVERQTSRQDDGSVKKDWEADGGVDINYNLTPGLKASITLNTDFAETEVDSRQINLTRFPLRFPERRAFFLEGTSIYQFAPRSGVNPYFSRRIGLDRATGQPVPITFGGRLIGRVGDYSLALMQVRTGELDSIKPEDFTVARIKKNFWRESSIGVIYTRRSTKDGESLSDPMQDRHSIGGDLEINTSEFLGDKNLQFQAFFVYHNASSLGDDSTDVWNRSTRGIRLNLPNRPWSGHVSYREFGDTFDPAVGFTPRRGFRRLQPTIGYNPLFEKSHVIRDISWEIEFVHLMDLDYRLLTQDLGFGLGEIQFETGDEIEFGIRRNFERLQGDFDIKGDSSIIVPEKEYVSWTAGFGLETASYRRFSTFFGLVIGEFWSGHRTEIETGFVVRPVPGINLSLEYLHADINLSQGSFKTDLYRINGNFDISPWVSFSSKLQFDNFSKLMAVNNRFRWTITPGSDVFFVYNRTWIREIGDFTTLDTKGAVKISFTHRF